MSPTVVHLTGAQPDFSVAQAWYDGGEIVVVVGSRTIGGFTKFVDDRSYKWIVVAVRSRRSTTVGFCKYPINTFQGFFTFLEGEATAEAYLERLCVPGEVGAIEMSSEELSVRLPELHAALFNERL